MSAPTPLYFGGTIKIGDTEIRVENFRIEQAPNGGDEIYQRATKPIVIYLEWRNDNWLIRITKWIRRLLRARRVKIVEADE